MAQFLVRLRLDAKGNRVRGGYRLPGKKDWLPAGECNLPVNGAPKASLQIHQGPKTVERWARLTEFRITRPDR